MQININIHFLGHSGIWYSGVVEKFILEKRQSPSVPLLVFELNLN
jgi:hypothetical protein